MTATTAEASAGHGSFWKLTLGSVGVVYGDIGTSPLYAMREAMTAASRDGLLAPKEVIGIVSLLLWTLILIVTLKYVVLVLRADNNGEGGTLSLVALAQRAVGKRTRWIFVLGVIGAALFYGDAIITPAISVLSAVEGLVLVEPRFADWVEPVAIAVLIFLFVIQSRGTERVAAFFGPITLVWFLTIGGLGLYHVGDKPAILAALNPWEAVEFLIDHRLGSLAVMGSVFLAVTGAEALYADMGHFGRGPIRVAWMAVVLPALALNYIGQGSLVLANPEAAHNSFFLLAPSWGLLPLVLLATLAAVIASQAVISGAYSLTHQAVQLGLLPRFEVRHTSESQAGQVYLPKVNWLLLIGVIMLVVIFGSSASLASAYGIAVTGTMIITTLLAYTVFRHSWGWSAARAALTLSPFLVVELIFLSANLEKFFDGGFVPVMLAAVVALLMATWVRGSAILLLKAHAESISLTSLLRMLSGSKVAQAPGTAVFLTSDPDAAPSALLHNLKHNHVLHARNIIVTVTTATTPTVPDAERIVIEPLSDTFSRIRLTFGYMEQPNVPLALALARKEGVKFDVMSTSFFLNRRTLKPSPDQRMPLWQDQLFISMSKSASDPTTFYRLPSNRVLELGQQMVV
jgi:KUP system potassium uptake protein